MGVTITCTNPQYTFDMGYSGFFALRKEIARCISPDFAEIYRKILYTDRAQDVVEEMDEWVEAHRPSLHKNIDAVVEFLLMPDCDGAINHKTCKAIYDIIKDIDFGGKIFQYSTIATDDYERFKTFLLDCYSHHKYMRWS